MSIKAMALAWYVGGVTPAQKAVLVALADHANDEGRHIYPSVETLTYKTSYSERTVRRALKDLRELSFIRVVREAKYHTTTEYELDLTEMQASQRRPDIDAPHDLPESPQGVPESPQRPARAAPNPSYNDQEPSEREDAREDSPPRSRFWQLPDNLDNPDFVRIWGRWMSYVDERGVDFTETQAELVLADLAAIGSTNAEDAVRRSILRGWRNIYLPDNGSGPPDKSVVSEWERVLTFTSKGRLNDLPRGPTRQAVLAIGPDRINGMQRDQRPFMFKEFKTAYEQATNKNQAADSKWASPHPQPGG